MLPRYVFLTTLLLVFGVSGSAWSQEERSFGTAYQWPYQQYVVLSDSLFPLHHVLAQGTRQARWPEVGPVAAASLEIYNLLVPLTPKHPAERPLTATDATWHKGDTLLISFSLLPNNQGRISWQPITLDTISASKMRSLLEVVQEGFARIRTYDQAGKPTNQLLTTQRQLLPIVRRQGHYWVPGPYVLTQYFRVRSAATRSLAQTDYVTINVKSPQVDSNAPYRTLRALLPSPLVYKYTHALPMGIIRAGAYRDVYEFWSRSPWTTEHEPNPLYYGSGIFEYKPSIGLLTGQYWAYFHLLDPGTADIFFDHITVDEKTHLR
ncbi:MAG: hypothetical protein ACRYFX_24405 [Janthinobacterium lividum]